MLQERWLINELPECDLFTFMCRARRQSLVPSVIKFNCAWVPSKVGPARATSAPPFRLLIIYHSPGSSPTHTGTTHTMSKWPVNKRWPVARTIGRSSDQLLMRVVIVSVKQMKTYVALKATATTTAAAAQAGAGAAQTSVHINIKWTVSTIMMCLWSCAPAQNFAMWQSSQSRPSVRHSLRITWIRVRVRVRVVTVCVI